MPLPLAVSLYFGTQGNGCQRVREALIKSLTDFILALDKNSYEIRFCE